MRKAITGLAIVSLVAGVALVAVSLSQAPSALAQDTEDQIFFQPLRDVLDDLVEDEVITEDQRDRITEAFEDRIVRFGRGFRGTPHLETVAEVLGMEVDELAEQLRDGSTIAEIAGDQTQDVVDALVAEHNARIDEAVAEERITEERAEEIRSALAEQVEAMVNGEHPTGIVPFGLDRFHGPRGFDRFHGPRGFDDFHRPRGFGGFGLGGGFGLDTIAEALGLDIDELREQLAEGSSLGEIAEAQGVAIDDIVEAVLAQINEQLDDLVADERLTEERADEIRANLTEAIESMLNGELPGLGDFHFEFKFGEGFPHFFGEGMPFPEELLDDFDGEGFPHFFFGPDGEFPFRGPCFEGETEGTGVSA